MSELTRSPHLLLQEELGGDLWQTLVACLFMNKTRRVVSEPIFREFMEFGPTAGAFLRQSEERRGHMIELLRPMGLQNSRFKRMESLAQELDIVWEHDPSHVYSQIEIRGLHSVGPYAGDAAQIFCCGSLPESEPDDGPLSAYWRWAKKNPTLYEQWLSERGL